MNQKSDRYLQEEKVTRLIIHKSTVTFAATYLLDLLYPSNNINRYETGEGVDFNLFFMTKIFIRENGCKSS